jgi:hypothetical protein
LLRADYPADAIWRAVLAGDDGALGTLDIHAGPVFLLVERGPSGVEVTRLGAPEWNFLAALCAEKPVLSAIEAATQIDAATALAKHLADGRFVGFGLTAPDAVSPHDEAA